MTRKETKRERESRQREEIRERLLASYQEGYSNLDLDNIPKSQHLELIWAFPVGINNAPLISKDQWLEQNIIKEMNQLTVVPTYKLQDPEAKVVKYRQRFVESARNLLPSAFEELRSLVPVFDALFSNETEKGFIAIVDDLQIDLINSRVTFNHESTEERWSRDYVWGDLKSTFYYADFALYIEYPEFDQILGSHRRRIIVENQYRLDRFSDTIARHFKESAADSQEILPNFFKLQGGIYSWVEKYHFLKDWLVDYAYYFISQFSQNPGIVVNDIPIPPRSFHSMTLYFPFEFKSRGWWSSEDGETVSEYVDRVTREFNVALDAYTIEATAQLGLDKLKKFTKPPTYENVDWLVYRVLKGWNSEQIVEKFFPPIAADRTRSTIGASAFQSKKKHVENQMRRLKEYGLPYSV